MPISPSCSLSAADFPRTHAVLNQATAEGVSPGFVAGLWEDRNPYDFRVAAFGNRRKEPSPLPMQVDTEFDLASLSKILATAPLFASLVDRGSVDWEDSIANIFPGFGHPQIHFSHLLSHTAGFLWWEPFYEQLQAEFAPEPLWKVSIAKRQKKMRAVISAVAPLRRVQEKAEYSDISFLLLGFAIEEILQMKLDRAVKSRVWDPMGITGFHYRPTQKPPTVMDEEVAATEKSPWHQAILQGQVHDENCWAMGGYSGHSGVFGRAEDVLKFSSRLFHHFFSDRVLKAMWEPLYGFSRTRGWDMPSGETPSVGKLFSPRSVGHLGFTGTSLWIDPEARLAVTLLSNRIHLTRDNIAIRALRPKFHDAIRMDLGR